LKNVGIINYKSILDYGVTGPILRAVGFPWDLRLTSFYDSYDFFNFSIPIGYFGDSYDRYLIRIEEMRQSTSIILQAMHDLNVINTKKIYFKKGSFKNIFKLNILDNKLTLPTRTFMKKSMESLIHHFKITTKGQDIDEGLTFSSVEAPKGEFSVFLYHKFKEFTPYRCKFKAPGFLHLHLLNF
jgi:NADH-quinone oxidoreductase subunit D